MFVSSIKHYLWALIAVFLLWSMFSIKKHTEKSQTRERESEWVVQTHFSIDNKHPRDWNNERSGGDDDDILRLYCQCNHANRLSGNLSLCCAKNQQAINAHNLSISSDHSFRKKAEGAITVPYTLVVSTQKYQFHRMQSQNNNINTNSDTKCWKREREKERQGNEFLSSKSDV